MSALEDQFLGLWQAHYPQLTFEREFSDIKAWEADYQERYAKSKRSKRYRADFAHIESFTAVEIQGGVYSRGRHVTGTGYESVTVAKSTTLHIPADGPYFFLLAKWPRKPIGTL
jgi:hypothetical protein